MLVELEPETIVNAQVFDVIDGDSLVVVLHLGEGQREEVRLIGIDAPEAGEPFADEARTALETLTRDPEVRLETGAEMRDQYGRLLAYVFAGAEPTSPDVFINAELLRRGLATVYTVPPNVKYLDGLERAEAEAHTAGAGMWSATKAGPLEIVQVEYDPPGDDTLDLNQEYIVFRVLATGSLHGYSVEDESGKHFDFPDRSYQKGQTIKLHSGRGANTATDLYWGVSGSAIWNNDGDTVKVLDPQGHIVASLAY
jgi:micrococcal nuclease